MARVTGIGGIFFKSQDPERLRRWYWDQLGIPMDEEGGWSFHWRDEEDPARVGRTVWGPFSLDTSYFDPSRSPLMFNFRVDDLDAILDDLRAAGVEVIDEIEEYPYGRFGWVLDPEGNKIELWEPRGEEGQESGPSGRR